MIWMDELRNIPAPEPSDDLLDRILASRAAGVRLVLPTGGSRWSVRPIGSVAAAVAMFALGWLALGVVGSSRRSTLTSRGLGVSEFLAQTPVFVTAGHAQQVQDTVGRAKYRLLNRIGDTRLTPGVWSYGSTLTVDGLVTTPQGSRHFSIAAGLYDGGPVWIIAAEGSGTYARAPFQDTLIVSRQDLRILHRARPFAPTLRMWEHPRDSSLYFLSWRYADVGWLGSVYRALFQLEPLDREWRGSVYLPWIHGKRGELWSYYALNMRTDGEERLTVPAGTFNTWRIAVEGRQNAMTVWVSKASGWVVKLAIPSGEDAVWEQRLVSATPPAP